MILGDDDAGQNLTFVEDLEALFIEPLFESELVFLRLCGCLCRGRSHLGGGPSDFSCRDSFVPLSHRGARPRAPVNSSGPSSSRTGEPVGAQDEQSSRKTNNGAATPAYAACPLQEPNPKGLVPSILLDADQRQKVPSSTSLQHVRAQRWQARHHHVPRCPITVRTSGRRQRTHGSPARP